MACAVPFPIPFLLGYDAERDLGLVANDLTAATDNTTKLNAALAAMWAGGDFDFLRGPAGPLLRPIFFSGKIFFFDGTITTAARAGGAMYGAGHAYELSDLSFYPIDGVVGGMATRLVMVGGTAPLLRLCGSNFHLAGLELWGRRIAQGGAGAGSGPKSATLIEVEGRQPPVSGRHLIEDVSLFEASVGIRALKGYYDGNSFVEYENHADQTRVRNLECSGVDTMFRSENAQAVGWNFDYVVFNSYGYGVGGVSEDGIILDIVRGGNVSITGWLQLGSSRVCVLKASTSHAPNANRFSIDNIEWDHAEDNSNSYLTLFKWAGNDGASSGYKFSVRMTGHVNNPDVTYDSSRLIEIGAGATGFPKGDLQFDITNMPTTNFTIIGGGPYYRPN